MTSDAKAFVDRELDKELLQEISMEIIDRALLLFDEHTKKLNRCD